MGREYLNYNPIAKNLSYKDLRLNENKDVDDLIKRIAENISSNFKKLVFDIASTKDRNPDSFRSKVDGIKGSGSVKSLIAKMKDSSSEIEIIDPHYAEVKQLYIASLNAICDALKRAVEIDSSLEAKAIEQVEKSLDTIQREMDKIAKEESKLFEGLEIGYNGRVDRLKKILISLVADSRGKDAKSGYGRDWQRLFSQLIQRLRAISPSSKNIISERDRKELLDLEKKTDNLYQEYNQYRVKASEQIMQRIQKDDELSQKMSDVSDMLTSALDELTKAFTQEGIVEVKVREDMEEKESRMNDRVFPIKLGDKDSDPRLRNSGLVKAIQKALIDAYAPLKNIMEQRGGADGKFETGTSVAVKAVQGAMDNKNVNGQVDRSLLDSILRLDQVSSENKKAIKASLDALRDSYANLSESSALSASDFMRMFENKTYIDPDRITDELTKYQDELESTITPQGSFTSDVMLAEKLAKAMRTRGYNKNAEAEDFLREDNTLKGSCPAEFVTAWTDAVSGDREVSYFAIEDEKGNISVYPTKRLSTNINKPCNWSGYSSVRGKDNEDVEGFGDWYTSYYKNFAGVDSETKAKAIEDVFAKNADMAREGLKEMESPYRTCSESLGSCKKEIGNGFIPPKVLGQVKSVIESVCGDDTDVEKMTPAEQRFLYNCSVFLSPLVSYDKKDDSWKCALEMATEDIDINAEDLVKKLSKNSSFRTKSSMMKESMCSLVPVKESETNTHCFECIEMDGDISDDGFAGIGDTAKKIPSVLRTKNKHLGRIAIVDLDSIPSAMKESIYIVPGSM